jgi:hypothetical protein
LMRPGPKPGKTRRKRGSTPAATDARTLGDCPAELTGPGREFWSDAAAHLAATGRASRVYRHPLRIVCRLLESLDGDMGINRMDTARRWLREMGLTVTSSPAATMETPEHGDSDTTAKRATGRARILSILDRKAARG